MSGQVQFFLHLNPQVVLCRAAFNKFSQSVLISGIALTLIQHLSLGLIETHEVLVGPLLKVFQVPQDGIPSFSHVN